MPHPPHPIKSVGICVSSQLISNWIDFTQNINQLILEEATSYKWNKKLLKQIIDMLRSLENSLGYLNMQAKYAGKVFSKSSNYFLFYSSTEEATSSAYINEDTNMSTAVIPMIIIPVILLCVVFLSSARKWWMKRN